LHEKCSDARRATKIECSLYSTRSATPQLGTFRANPSGRCLAGGPPQRPRQGNGAAQAGHTIALPGLASLRLRLARSPALLRALRIVRLFVCGSRRASRPAQQRRGPMGFCISLLGCQLQCAPLALAVMRDHLFGRGGEVTIASVRCSTPRSCAGRDGSLRCSFRNCMHSAAGSGREK
jgi:hypothetical protein